MQSPPCLSKAIHVGKVIFVIRNGTLYKVGQGKLSMYLMFEHVCAMRVNM